MTDQQTAGMTYVEADQVTGSIGGVLVADLALQTYDNWLAFRQSPRANNLLHDQFAAAGFARVFRMAGWAVTRYLMMRPDDLPRMDRAHFQHLLDAIAAGHVRYVENRYVDALPAQFIEEIHTASDTPRRWTLEVWGELPL